MNIKIVLQYDGSRYDGWQKQGNTDQTIQGKLEEVLGRMAGQPVEVHGSGRTDRGVHALGQTANFHLPDSPAGGGWKTEDIQSYLNRYLPEDIRVLETAVAPPRFHSRLNACSKTYRYVLETGEKRDVFQRRWVCALGEPLDVDRMKRAARYLCGTHDFKSFCSLKRMKKSTVRTLERIDVETDGSLVTLSYTGDGFLYNMVRILTGTLVEVGLGIREPESMKDVLEAKDRQQAGKTMPPEGLSLVCVKYFPSMQ